MGGTGFAGIFSSQDSGYEGVPIAGHALWAEFWRGILCVTLGEFTSLHKNVPHVIMVMEVIPFFAMLYMPTLVGRPSLHGSCGCVV